jgi:hypothetical protein
MLDRQDSHIVRQVILLDYSAQHVMKRTLQQLQFRIPIGSQSNYTRGEGHLSSFSSSSRLNELSRACFIHRAHRLAFSGIPTAGIPSLMQSRMPWASSGMQAMPRAPISGCSALSLLKSFSWSIVIDI